MKVFKLYLFALYNSHVKCYAFSGYSSIPTETDSTDFEYMKPDDTRIEITQTIGISDAKL